MNVSKKKDFVMVFLSFWKVKVSHIMRENAYPFLGLVVLKQSRLVVCERVEGAVPLDDLIRRLRSSMTDNEGELVVERTERLRRLEDQQLRMAQDQAFQESLEAETTPAGTRAGEGCEYCSSTSETRAHG